MKSEKGSHANMATAAVLRHFPFIQNHLLSTKYQELCSYESTKANLLSGSSCSEGKDKQACNYQQSGNDTRTETSTRSYSV